MMRKSFWVGVVQVATPKLFSPIFFTEISSKDDFDGKGRNVRIQGGIWLKKPLLPIYGIHYNIVKEYQSNEKDF